MTFQSQLDNIESELHTLCSVAPFKDVMFYKYRATQQYPAIHFELVSREQFDEPHMVNTTLQLRWELTYNVTVLHSRFSMESGLEDACDMVNTVVDLFVSEMPEANRLNSCAWWINPETVTYGVIEVPNISELEYVAGGVIGLTIRILEDVS